MFEYLVNLAEPTIQVTGPLTGPQSEPQAKELLTSERLANLFNIDLDTFKEAFAKPVHNTEAATMSSPNTSNPR